VEDFYILRFSDDWVICPFCETELEFKKEELPIELGDTFNCPSCGIGLEIVELTPLEAEPIFD